jgi:hypothetical protein
MSTVERVHITNEYENCPECPSRGPKEYTGLPLSSCKQLPLKEGKSQVTGSVQYIKKSINNSTFL